jgi:hypothetical protein
VAIIQLLRGLMDQKRMQFGPLAGLADPKPAPVIHAMRKDPTRAFSAQTGLSPTEWARERFGVR